MGRMETSLKSDQFAEMNSNSALVSISCGVRRSSLHHLYWKP